MPHSGTYAVERGRNRGTGWSHPLVPFISVRPQAEKVVRADVWAVTQQLAENQLSSHVAFATLLLFFKQRTLSEGEYDVLLLVASCHTVLSIMSSSISSSYLIEETPNANLQSSAYFFPPSDQGSYSSQLYSSRTPIDRMEGSTNAERANSASTIRHAQCESRDEGGCLITIPAGVLSCRSLKRALDSRFPGQYSVQLRKDVFKITLPNLQEAELDELKMYLR